MIEISQKDFEAKVQDVIDGKTTRVKLIEELKTDKVTLNNKIQELAAYNPKLYKEFIAKFPYRPREYTHIDYEALIIDILKNGYNRRDWDEVYGISSATILRKIYVVERENPELVELYREVASYRKKQETLPKELKEQIAMLESREIFLGEVCDKKREELLEKEKQYNDAILSGMGAKEASKKVGHQRVSKVINTLNRIELERRTRQNNDETVGKKEEIEGER